MVLATQRSAGATMIVSLAMAVLAASASPANAAPPLPSDTDSVSVTLPSLAAGDEFSCALSPSGVARCWGSNAYGQLGLDSVVGQCRMMFGIGTGPCQLMPKQAVDTMAFRTLSVGRDHVCGLDHAGVAYCWGGNVVGQLGADPPTKCAGAVVRGATNPIPCSPHPVRVDWPERFSAIAAAEYFTCALTAGDGHPVCWGSAKGNRVGTGNRFDRHPTPHAIPTTEHFVSIVAGNRSACAISTQQELFCWGGDVADVPTHLPAPTKVAEVSLGSGSTCLLGVDARIYCWGTNAAGQLGVGTKTGTLTNARQPVTTDQRFRSVVSGFIAACGVTISGDLYCWGDGHVVGTAAMDACWHVDENAPCATQPTRMPVRDVVAMTMGLTHACAVTRSAAVYCWGSNSAGEFGDGTTVSSVDPKLITRSPGN